MKFLSLLALTLLVSCGDSATSKVGEGDTVEGTQTELSTEDQGKFAIICNSIDYKTGRLGSDSREFTFDYKTLSCEKGSKIVSTEVITKIEESRTNNGQTVYAYKVENGKSYTFKEIETSDTGVMKKVCDAVRVVGEIPKSPTMTGKASAVWFSTTSQAGCESDSNHFCVQLLYGSSSDEGKTFKRHTRELLKIRITDDVNKGFVVARMKYATIGCDEGRNEFSTVLK